jgi:DNA-binding transcriptional regulator GbsR (MarR family)
VAREVQSTVNTSSSPSVDASEDGRRGPQDAVTRSVLDVSAAAGQFIEYWGFKALYGRIWTLLALHRAPLAQTEIAELLGVSRSAVSTAMAELLELGLAKPRDDHRHAPWEAVIDVWPTIAGVLRSREWMLLEAARTALEAAIEEVEIAATDPRASAEVPWDIDRLRMLLAMTEMGQGFLKMLMALRMPRTPDGFQGWMGRASQIVARLRGGR